MSQGTGVIADSPAGAGGGWHTFSLTGLSGNCPALTWIPDLWPLELGEKKSLLFKPLACGTLSRQPQGIQGAMGCPPHLAASMGSQWRMNARSDILHIFRLSTSEGQTL